MKVDDGFEIRTLKTFDEVYGAISYFLPSISRLGADEGYWERFAKQIVKTGVAFAIYLDGEMLGYISGYANNHETKRAHGNLLVISHEAGLLRGVIWEKLFYTFMTYAKSQGMEYFTAQVMDWNTYAGKQYLSLGAKVIGRDDEYSYDWIIFNIQDVLDKLDGA